ncbi:hypothetical protein C1S99_10865 [Vibrio parahaemolyticus]|uniref:hypothetical protein n=1 Tax=Vibrio parahaemolyticus TaxID=670 RepID=UPI000C86B3E4|nr:hypothetical protein [Vibrio parahaemolyticus]EJB8688778.1 hypothetical protein [Vibrio parahaemolyticus]PMS42210.1 hypothetical protein C1T12_11350 [Vibrio parahaemolyticus]PMS62270.1 hypothetical protein C1S91_15595 [Vibrio parahaemolyticus]PMS68199.1 hypothetical protein C1S96_11780 [Vibrio parahaemolyticus]PMS72971.1 hypothetical protein C1T10_14560 [Vibrio parahaemolyticus]
MQFSKSLGSVNTSPIQADGDHKTHMVNIADVAADVAFKAGHIVLVDESGITARWDGTLTALALVEEAPAAEGEEARGLDATEVGPPMLAIVVADKFEGDEALMCLRWGSYVADKRVVTADDLRITASGRITLSRYGLFDKGTW